MTFTAKEKEEDITKCVNLRHLSLLCIQLYRQGGQEAYFQGKLYGEAGHYYHRYPATVFFHISPTEEEEEDAFDRDYNEACWRVYGSSSNY